MEILNKKKKKKKDGWRPYFLFVLESVYMLRNTTETT